MSFQPGDQVAHATYASYGIGSVESLLTNELLPSIPPKRARVRFGGVSRVCFLDDLVAPSLRRIGGRPELVVVGGGDVA